MWLLEKNGQNQLDRSRGKRSIIKSQGERSILHRIKRRKANWIGHILRRNCLLKRVIEGKVDGRIEEKGSLGRRRKQLLYDLKATRGYGKLKKEALDRTVWRT